MMHWTHFPPGATSQRLEVSASRNQFGFNLTGPVRIPWLYNNRDNTFFSATYEGTRKNCAPLSGKHSTAQQRTGDSPIWWIMLESPSSFTIHLPRGPIQRSIRPNR
jgi:hypothetical protein